MSTKTHDTGRDGGAGAEGDTRHREGDTRHRHLVANSSRSHRSGAATAGRWFDFLVVALRLSIGWVFLWAFLDKLFGLGHETARSNSWINGGQPTRGFLKSATGPFAGFYQDLAGLAWVDWLFMMGLAGIGIALVTGVAVRLAAVCGAVLLVMMWSAVLPPENNPIIDFRIIDALVLMLLALMGAGYPFGLAERWEKLSLVNRYRWLR